MPTRQDRLRRLAIAATSVPVERARDRDPRGATYWFDERDHMHALYGDDIDELESLASEIAASPPLGNVSANLVEDTIRRVLADAADGLREPDGVYDAVRDVVRGHVQDFESLVPITGLAFAGTSFELGSTTIYRSLANLREARGELASGLDGFTLQSPPPWDAWTGPVAVTRVAGDQDFARNLAIARVDRALDIVRTFLPYVARRRSRVGLEAGRVHDSRVTKREVVLLAGERSVAMSARERSHFHAHWPSGEFPGLVAPYDQLWTAWADLVREDPDGVAREPGIRRLNAAVHFLGRANEEPLASDMLLYCIVGLEALTSLDERSGELTERVAERSAFLYADDAALRRFAYRAVRSAYGSRSRYVHGDRVEITKAEGEQIARITIDVLANFVVHGLHTKTDGNTAGWFDARRFGQVT